MAWIDRISSKWGAIPLVAKMVVLVIVLLVASLTVSATVMIGLLQRHLINQIDDQLFSSSATLVDQTAVPDSPNVPTLFYIRRTFSNGTVRVQADQQTLQRFGRPEIPELLAPGKYADTSNLWTRPVTVASSIRGATWRVVTIPLVIEGTNVSAGLITIGLPLSDVQRTLRSIGAYFLVASIVIVVIGGMAGRYLVRRALLPLRNIESVAGKIAAGDLTQRIDPQPLTTEVGSLALSLNTMLTQVERSFEAREETEQRTKRFVSDASHELRTPLAAIRGYGELYQMGGIPDQRVPEVMGRIQSEATRMGSLVEDLLTLARLDEGRKLRKGDVDLVKMIDNTAYDLKAMDPSRDVKVISLNGKKAPMTLVVFADRDQIQQVFTNLVGNMVRYTPNGSPVEFAMGAVKDQAVIEFRDHGPGIAPEEHQRVFERFYRTEESRVRTKGGSGLGLAIVSGILQAHQGQASLKTTPGGGLTVHIELPLHNNF